MRQLPRCSLWLGHIGDVRDPSALIREGILAVIDLAMNEPIAVLPREMAYCRFPLIDGEGNPPWLLRAAVETVAGLIRSETPTLIYCAAGMSRTPAIAGAAIAKACRRPLGEGLQIASQTGPVDVTPQLWAEIEVACHSSL